MYCELKGAKTVAFASDTPLVENIIQQLQEALVKHQHIDVITLTANGEPTLYPDLDILVDKINRIKGTHKLLILSNGSTISNPAIQAILSKIDIVKLSLDCVSEKCFKKLDRAHGSIDIDSIIEGMKVFRQSYQGELVIEILVVKGFNDTKAEFEKLNQVLQAIGPNRIDVGTIDRPPAYGVEAVSMERLIELSSYLSDLPVHIAYSKHYIAQKRTFTEDEILAMMQRRPQSFEDIHACFDEHSLENLKRLLEDKKVFIKQIAGVSFYTCE